MTTPSKPADATDYRSGPFRRNFVRLTAVLVALGAAGFCFLKWNPFTHPAGKFPEELVHVRTEDGIVNGGAIFTPPSENTKPIAIIWIHGWGVNFYSPGYVKIGRSMTEHGYACIMANTRMHDLGNVAGQRAGKRLRGGGYWGVASEEARDLAAWIDFAEERGFKHVVLVGHSAGWSAVRHYQVERLDPRVVGVVLASGPVRAETRPTDPDQLAEATRMMAEGRPDDLVRDPKRSFPSFISAATFIDLANTPPEFKDFFGVQTPNPAVTRLKCPLLAFFGTREKDVGTAADLEQLKSCIKRQTSGPSRVETAMIQGGDHMYHDEEKQVAEVISKWADSLPPHDLNKRDRALPHR